MSTEKAGRTRTRFVPAADKIIKENIEVQSMATALISTIGLAVRDQLPEGIMTWKKIMTPAGEKCTPDNQVGYFNRV